MLQTDHAKQVQAKVSATACGGEFLVPRRPVSKPIGELLSAKIADRLTRDLSASTGPRVGPYILGKTLGVGSTGRVRLGTHIETGTKVAVKIICKGTIVTSPGTTASSEGLEVQSARGGGLSGSVRLLDKTEREITIMKLIQHPNVMQLHDVYETDKELFLILEHVEGGELFDYLIARGKLNEDEALGFFQQIARAVSHCHMHMICHRDLKPENILLDKNGQIKIADFGMASLQAGGRMLATSCGSPHYASPEIIRGMRYDGAAADVWSCGVILYAMLTGNLPFDDENIRTLLGKVKTGVFHIPSHVSAGAQDLIRSMLVVDPCRRTSFAEIFKHRWFVSRTYAEPAAPSLNAESPCENVCGSEEGRQDSSAATVLLDGTENDPDYLDLDVVGSLGCLGWIGSEDELIRALLSPEKTLEKVFYNLLLQRKSKPCVDNLQPTFDSAYAVRAKRRIQSMPPHCAQYGAFQNEIRAKLVGCLSEYKKTASLHRCGSDGIETLTNCHSSSDYSLEEKDLPPYLDASVQGEKSAECRVPTPAINSEPQPQFLEQKISPKIGTYQSLSVPVHYLSTDFLNTNKENSAPKREMWINQAKICRISFHTENCSVQRVIDSILDKMKVDPRRI